MILLSDYITSVGGVVSNRTVNDAAARLALTGIAANYTVEQVDTEVVWKFTGADPSVSGDWTDVTSSADCTAAFQAALDAAANMGSVTIQFPTGVIRMLGAVSANFTLYSGLVILQGDGSAVKFIGSQYVRWTIGTPSQIIMQDLVFLGSLLTPTATESVAGHFFIGGDQAIVRNCLFYGLGLSGPAAGILNGEQTPFYENCMFRGCYTLDLTSSCIYLKWLHQATIHKCFFIDYGQYFDTVYSKNGGTGGAFIEVNNPISSTERHSYLIIRDTFCDEGPNTAIKLINMLGVLMDNVSINNHLIGIEVHQIKSVRLNTSLLGYTTNENVGILAEDVDFMQLDSVYGDYGIHRIQLTGTPGKLVMNNSHTLNGQWDVENTAGSEYVRDGVAYKGTVAQVG